MGGLGKTYMHPVKIQIVISCNDQFPFGVDCRKHLECFFVWWSTTAVCKISTLRSLVFGIESLELRSLHVKQHRPLGGEDGKLPQHPQIRSCACRRWSWMLLGFFCLSFWCSLRVRVVWWDCVWLMWVRLICSDIQRSWIWSLNRGGEKFPNSTSISRATSEICIKIGVVTTMILAKR